MKRRIQRIYPTFLVVLAVYVVLSLSLRSFRELPTGPCSALLYIAENVLLLPGIVKIDPIIAVSWSLSYEMFFYLMVPIVIRALDLRQWRPQRRIVLFLIVGLLVLLAGVRMRIALFVTGMILYDSTTIRTPLATSWGLGLYALAVGLVAVLGHAGEIGAIRYAVLALTFYVLCRDAMGETGATARFFRWRPLRWLGNMSYSYYLIHGLALHVGFLAMSFFLPSARAPGYTIVAMLPALFAVTVVASAVLYLLVERPWSLLPQTPQARPLRAIGQLATAWSGRGKRALARD